MLIDLRQGLGENEQYKAWIFPGGEIHLKFSDDTVNKLNYFQNVPYQNLSNQVVDVITKLNSSNDLMLLFITLDTIRKDWDNKICVHIPYMAYQQADRDFAVGESFSLKTVTKLLNSFDVNRFFIYDAHSDVAPALFNRCTRIDNTNFIREIIRIINSPNLVLMSPDAGAFKKIFKLAEKLEFKGTVLSCSKYRDEQTQAITTKVPDFDFKDKDVLIIDDILLGGRTFKNISDIINSYENKPNRTFLAVSHGIFSTGYEQLFESFDKIFVSESRVELPKHEKIAVRVIRNQFIF